MKRNCFFRQSVPFLWLYQGHSLLKSFILVLVLTFSCIQFNSLKAQQNGSAQQNVVKGQVIDSANGQPLEGVTVAVEGKKIRTATDRSGNFTLSVPAGSGALERSGV